ncbi:hypothetical protein SAMN05421505_12742 [Sinosporangium album]|uniref:Uncharacterized protein n=1 Tax=Sinosporangium album TaxID=504805 RepID=A0A1G8GHA3_9ACTN|nr:hypothetical protein [Sinosporangium album]SDH93758.1 hypothetical protein SAMN05421505_12742 [Sinosporangium album]
MAHDLRGPVIRQLAESGGPFHHWRGDDEDGGIWLFETVEGEGEHWAVRQIEIDPARVPHRYWWRHLEDRRGFLTDQAVEIWSLTQISAEAFEAVWRSQD